MENDGRYRLQQPVWMALRQHELKFNDEDVLLKLQVK